MVQEHLVMGSNRRFGSARPTAAEAVSRRHTFRANQPFEPVPAPTGLYPYRLDLAQVVSAAAMEAIVTTGRLVFHMVGDTGGVKHPLPQQIAAIKMEDDFQRADGPAPSFLYILGGGYAHCLLPPGAVTQPVRHRTVREIWYVHRGRGELWRRDDDGIEEVVPLVPGTCVDIPLRTAFQFRNSGDEALEILLLTMARWPGPDEAMPVDVRRWTPAPA
jgi:mannose-6-phosphate isomerase-like protein (cupin superfamily)